MSKLTLTGLILPLVLLLSSSDAGPRNSATKKSADSQLQPVRRSLDEGGSGTLQKMIVESGSVTMNLDLNRLNGISSTAQKLETLRFAVAANSFFPILVFNDLLRGPEPGSIALIPAGVNTPGYNNLPLLLAGSIKQLVIEKLPSDREFDLAVQDGNTGFTFFNVEGDQYDYDANAKLLSITDGRMLISKEFAESLGRASDVSVAVGKISIGAAMQPIEIDRLVNGELKSMAMPPLRYGVGSETPTLVPGPDVIVGDLPEMAQYGNDPVNHLVGLGVGTTSCNNGDQPFDWFALPQTDHPVIPQNFYRMSGGATNDERFEQIGQSWMKHAFTALEGSVCGTCNTSGCTTGTHLCPGCSDPYSASLNYSQTGIGSRAWVNPFTGVFPSGANNHTGHTHLGASHRVRVPMSDLDPTQNPGATYFAEGQYITPHEYSWCQQNPGQCNMYNNASYRQFTVSGGPSTFTFSPVGSTQRMLPAIMAWTGATISNRLEPDPGNDGIFFVGYKVTGPSNGIYHYEYAIYNENLDRAIQSFEVVTVDFIPLLTNVGFHAPPQEPGWANDGTFNNQGYSSQPWTFTQIFASATWTCETFVQNQNANAVRYGTLYNFRFDSSAPPAPSTANIGFFKTGSPISVPIQAPAGTDVTPTATPSATATATATSTPTPTSTVTATATATATATSTSTPTPTATAIATPTPTPTSTPRPTPTPRSSPPPRPRPTPPPRP